MPFPGDTGRCPSGFRTNLPAGQHAGFASAGQTRSFYLALPAARFTGPRPLLVAFHGTGQSGREVFSSYGLADWVNDGFVVLAPDSNGNGSVWPVWDALDLPGTPAHANADLTLFDELLVCVAGHHAVDARRIYVGGHSAGGAMSHYMLGRRSSVLAGGVPASGAFDLTQTFADDPLEPLMVIVTWGGSNDVYSGSAGDAAISNIGYAEQSSIASQHWERRPGSHQIACRGNELGHGWLNPINSWLREVLLAHPKGGAVVPGWSMPPLPAGAPVVCDEDAASYTPAITVSCPASAVEGCQHYCQLIGDCLVENGTLGPVVVDQIVALGFADTANVCTHCVELCAQDASGSAGDAAVLSCLGDAAPACGPGFAGAAVLGAVGACCGRASGSRICERYCATFSANALMVGLLTGC